MKNKDDFNKIIKNYSDMIYKLAFVYTKKTEEANDVTQNVLLNMFKCKKKFKSNEHIKYYITKSTINECKKIWRNPWHRHENIDDFELKSTDNMEQKNESIMLYENIMKLNIKQRSVIILFYIFGYSLDDISKLLKIPVGTVGSRLSTAKKSLKKYLKGDSDE